jgi:hypothetical protein
MDITLFQHDVEKKQHENAIESLCDQHPDRCRQIRLKYEEEVTRLLPQATIRSYLPTFISRDIHRSFIVHQ